MCRSQPSMQEVMTGIPNNFIEHAHNAKCSCVRSSCNIFLFPKTNVLPFAYYFVFYDNKTNKRLWRKLNTFETILKFEEQIQILKLRGDI